MAELSSFHVYRKDRSYDPRNLHLQRGDIPNTSQHSGFFPNRHGLSCDPFVVDTHLEKHAVLLLECYEVRVEPHALNDKQNCD
jgi:hypothetical protein